MDVRSRAERLWARYVGVGIIMQILGGLTVYWTLTDQIVTDRPDHQVALAALGAVVAILGIWALVAGLVMAGVAIAMGATLGWAMLEGDRGRPLIGSAQTDPADLASDRLPFIPHESDSPAVAAVRRAIMLGKSHAAVRRVIEKHTRGGRLTDADRAMVDALVAESQARPLGPLPPQY